MGFSRQEYWSKLPFPPQGIFQTQGLNPRVLHLLTGSRFFTTSATWGALTWTLFLEFQFKNINVKEKAAKTDGQDLGLV